MSILSPYIRKDFIASRILSLATQLQQQGRTFEEHEQAIIEAGERQQYMLMTAIGHHLAQAFPDRVRGPIAEFDGLQKLRMVADARRVILKAVQRFRASPFLVRRALIFFNVNKEWDDTLAIYDRHPVAHSDVGCLHDAIHACRKLRDFDKARELAEKLSLAGVNAESLKASIRKEEEDFTAIPLPHSIFVELNDENFATQIWRRYRDGDRSESFFLTACQLGHGEAEGAERVLFFRKVAFKLFPENNEFRRLFARALFCLYEFEGALGALTARPGLYADSPTLKLVLRAEDFTGLISQASLVNFQTSADFALLHDIRELNKGYWRQDVRASIAKMPSVLERANYDVAVAKSVEPKLFSIGEMRRPPKVALCISGQLRSSRKNLPALEQIFVTPLKADTFIHTWETEHLTPPRFRHLNRFLGVNLADKLPPELQDHVSFSRQMPATTRKLQSAVTYKIDESYLSERLRYCKAVIEPDDNFTERFRLGDGLSFARRFNQAKMFYKINACDGLRLAHEAETSCHYDVVIRCRPDLTITLDSLPQIIEDCHANTNRIYVHYADVLGAGDQLAIGSRHAMGIYSSLWVNLLNFQKFDYLPGFSGRPAEELLADHALSMGLEVRLLPAYAFDLVADLAIYHHDLTGELDLDIKKLAHPERMLEFRAAYEDWKMQDKLAR